MENINYQPEPGDILHGKHNRNTRKIKSHYMIYLKPYSEDLFLGAMLTSSSNYGNIPLGENHFEKYKENRHKYDVYYKSSFISRDLYFKKNEWQPFTKVGQLSKEGLKFVLAHIGEKEPIYFPHNEA